MKTLILYASRYGATEQIVNQMAKELGNNVTVKNIKEGKPVLSNYDAVIIGGSIYMNKIQKRIISFLKSNEKELMKKPLGLFIGCYTPAGTKGYLEQFFPHGLLKHAKTTGMLGGIMQYDKMNFFYRMIFKSLKKIDDFNKEFVEPKIETENIKKFVEEFK